MIASKLDRLEEKVFRQALVIHFEVEASGSEKTVLIINQKFEEEDRKS